MSDRGKSTNQTESEPRAKRPRIKTSLAACKTPEDEERYREFRARANERNRRYNQRKRDAKNAGTRETLLARSDPTNVRNSPTRAERRFLSEEEEARMQAKVNRSSSMKNWEIINMPMEDFLDLSYFPSDSSDDEDDTNNTDGDGRALPPGYRYAKAPKTDRPTAQSITRDAERASFRVRCEENMRVAGLDEERMLDPIVDFLEKDNPAYWDPRYT